MQKPESINLRIEHVGDHKILFIECSDNYSAYDLNISVVMIQNFIENCNKNKIKFAWVFDIQNVSKLPIFTFEEISRFCKKNYPIICENLICSCIISNDGLFKNFFKIFTKMYQPTKPIKNFSPNEECMSFVQDCLQNKYNNDTILY